ncbi:Mg2+ transporter protein CorA-like/Zinc transport protein ZntB [Penicillium longicatenatum]|uniref:Mg2+ transporter protein CorA-like/Zinc transport protein ZntB n=1 Tax=Penicillium longicatenatum TaxID=1561947 RepID=UPI002549ADBB|nr:Mg2+ transporter protein CorA-like/Zinc transport protein ZntB [Penicillium longicatenatum]KAJ5650892.1 Mg2+ transporter protein CorA-like/Zinc transport protein ZntB [Penicillium longicatenatum]
MLEELVNQHNINLEFWQLPLSFFERSQYGLDLEQVFCVPYTESRTGSCIEISYTIRYPEYKAKVREWTIRQTGLYHKYDSATSQSTFILINPTPRSKAFLKAVELLQNASSEKLTNPFWLHSVLFSTYLPAWRERMLELERQFLPLAKTTYAAFIDEPLSLKYNTLNVLTKLEGDFLQMPTILAGAIDVLDELSALIGSIDKSPSAQSELQILKNHRRKCCTHSRTSMDLQQRVQSVARLLADTLLLRDQVVTTEQNEQIYQLNKSAVFITRLSLLYLPPSFIATMFGMNFFAMDQVNSSIVGTSMIWIFFVASVGLTALTFLIYYLLGHRNSVALPRLTDRGQTAPQRNFQAMMRRFTGPSTVDTELQNLHA